MKKEEMASKKRKLRFRLMLATIVTVIVVLVFPTSLGLATISAVGADGFPLLPENLAEISESLAESAEQFAAELFGDYPEKSSDFTSQLLTTYEKARDKDVIIFFNSGGWGWNLAETSSGWLSILGGIQTELRYLGYTSLVLNYQRTERSIIGQIDECVDMLSLYPEKSKNLAYQAEFLTNHIPDLKVILAGESDGTIICDMAMSVLRDNPRVYSIQTGPPFWHKQRAQERSLALTSSGLGPDVFSRGDLLAMLAATLENFFGLPRPVDSAGHIMYYIGAPGHDYRWSYPGVHNPIIDFLYQNFEPKF